MYKLSEMYEKGHVIEQNFEKAFKLYRKATELDKTRN